MAYFERDTADGGSAYSGTLVDGTSSGTYMVFDVSPDLGVATGKDFSIIQSESFGGDEFTVQRHTGKRTWQLSFSFVSSAFKTKLENFRNTVGGPYRKFTYNDGSTSYSNVRMSADSLQFTEVAPSVYSTSMQIRQATTS
jgi:hypothetical protein|tara:strand:+ start:328 stop:747 length:420 start_codon:yes stop_codon:yes gene_type:complete